MSETIESLEARITNIEKKLDIVVNSLGIILNQFENIEQTNTELCGNMQCISEELVNNVAYLEEGEIY